MNPESLLKEARAMAQQTIEDRRTLHRCAETGFDLENTCAYVRSRLEHMGLEPRSCGRSGLVCTLGRPGKTILLRADMDALPVTEESGLPFACADGRMHACGHDMHAAMLLSAAQLLKQHEYELPGTVKLMFQPAEEPLQGAQDMIEAGVLEHPRVDAAAMLHVMTAHPIPTGTAIVSAPGVSAPAAGMFSVVIQGKGTHGAMPDAGVDPVNVAAHIIIALQEINARELAVNERAALTIGMVQAGATANVIPNTALVRGSFRSFSDETVEFIRRRIVEISKGMAALFRAEAEVTFDSSCPTLLNDEGMCKLAESCGAALLGRDKVFSAAKLGAGSAGRSSGSEDFAAISHHVPSVMVALAAGHPEDGYVHPLHHPKVRFDEAALADGSALYASIAMEWLRQNCRT